MKETLEGSVELQGALPFIDRCLGCLACVTACPANLFAPTADGGILFNYEQCFECGTCYQVCDGEGAITWTYPDGGHGVIFRNG